MRLQRYDLAAARRLRPPLHRRTFVQGGLGLVTSAVLGGAADSYDLFALPEQQEPGTDPDPEPPPPPAELSYGMGGDQVWALQEQLGASGYWCGAPDGGFGHLTQQAVFAVQKAHGLVRDGVVGPPVGDVPGLLGRGVCGQGLDGAVQRRIGGEVGIHQLDEALGFGVAACRGLADEDGREGRDALPEISPGGLPGGLMVCGDVDDVIGQLEGHAHQLAVLDEGLDRGLGGAGEQRAVLAGRGDQGAGLALKEPQPLSRGCGIHPFGYTFQ